MLGANDGIVSVASLIVGVAAAGSSRSAVLLAGIAGLVAGAMSMAAGEYVSVSSQADTEAAELAREQVELRADPGGEEAELAAIYVSRGVAAATAATVATQLTAYDALGAHAHDELQITATTAARPVQAAVASALSFTAGAALPLAVALFAPPGMTTVVAVSVVALLALAILGATSARAGGAEVMRATIRVVFWGALALLITAGIGRLIGAEV